MINFMSLALLEICQVPHCSSCHVIKCQGSTNCATRRCSPAVSRSVSSKGFINLETVFDGFCVKLLESLYTVQSSWSAFFWSKQTSTKHSTSLPFGRRNLHLWCTNEMLHFQKLSVASLICGMFASAVSATSATALQLEPLSCDHNPNYWAQWHMNGFALRC